MLIPTGTAINFHVANGLAHRYPLSILCFALREYTFRLRTMRLRYLGVRKSRAIELWLLDIVASIGW